MVGAQVDHRVRLRTPYQGAVNTSLPDQSLIADLNPSRVAEQAAENGSGEHVRQH